MKKTREKIICFQLQILIMLLIPIFGQSQDDKRFTLLKSSYTGVNFENTIKSTKDKNILLYANFYSGAGVGVGDFNNDGLQDIYFAGNMVQDRIYLNQGNLTFKDVTKEAGIVDDDGWSAGVTIADVNNDGYVDIYVSRELYDYNPEKRINLLYINQGNGTFIESAKEYGVDDSQRTRHAVFLDYDRDGFLDIFLLTQPPNAGILSEFIGSNKQKAESHVRLLRNTGENSFEDVTEKAGVKRSGYPNAVCTADLNNDGWVDIYVTNDFKEPDFLFMNNKNGTFTNVVDSSTGHISHFAMGVDISDINNDGHLDVFVVDMVAEDNFRLKSNMGGMDPEAFWRVVNKGGHYQYMFNTLQLNNGNMAFSDVAQMTGMGSTDWSWSNLMADFDNDGLKDTYVTNGLLHDIMNTDADKAVADFIDKTSYDWILAHPDGGGITSIFDILDLQKAVNMVPSNPISNYAYKNKGNLQFEKVMDEWGLEQKSFSNGSAYADFDNDGDLDLVVNNVNEEAFIYRNNSESLPNSNFFRVKLKDGKNRPVFGARVALFSKEGMQIQETTNVRGIYSCSEPIVHFGLGENQKIDSLEISWPNHKKTTLKNLMVNQVIELDMDKAVEPQKNNDSPTPIFKEDTDSKAIEFVHQENIFDDYGYQVLLPHKMSQFGPAMDVSDINNDGLEDIFIGGAQGFSPVLYTQNSEGQFLKSSQTFWENEKAYEDLDALFVDINGDGYKDLYVVSGGNEFPAYASFYYDRLYLNDGRGGFSERIELSGAQESGSIVKAEDYDNDGDMDLFVGGRHVPRQYPLPASSILWTNDNGKLVDNTNVLAPELKDVGMVTDAVWADYDNDGDSDLIIVGEWMPITVFKNDAGKFSKTPIKGLENSSGWWFSIEKGDFDQDGDIDFIVGNLGLNYKYKTSKEKPFDIYYDDFDKNGSSDIVLGYYNSEKHYPLRGFSCSSQQIPGLKTKFEKYDTFASLELDQVYGKRNLEESLHYEADTFASSYMENLGNGSFKLSNLPHLAQLSNINDILVDDFNSDGNLDALLVGNLFVSEVETPRNDGGTGLFLLGDTKGKFQTVSPWESGFYARGDAKKMKPLMVLKKPKIMVANNNDQLQIFDLHKK